MYGPTPSFTPPRGRSCGCQAQLAGMGAVLPGLTLPDWSKDLLPDWRFWIAGAAGIGLVYWLFSNRKAARMRKRRRAKAVARARYQTELKRIERAYA